MLYIALEKAGFSYIVVHDEKGAQCDVDWPRKETHLEARLREKFGGTTMSLKFERMIRQAYNEVLARDPDPSGLASYNTSMKQGLSEALMREHLIRSPEYHEKNPETPEGDS